MKIIQIVPYYPPHLGGMQNVAREISERLAKKGHEVEVFTSDIGCKRGKLKSTKNLKIHYLKSWEIGHSAIIPALFFRLFGISKDVVMHVHASRAFTPEIACSISRIRGIPYIVHFHGDVDPSGKLGFLLPLYKEVFLKKVLSKAQKVICLSKDYKKFVNKKYKINKKKIIVVPNGVDEKFFVSKKKLASKNINLLFVGRLSVEKNIPKLIKATSLLKSKVVLHIIGDGEKRTEIEKLIYEKKLKNVILHGKKTGKKLIDFYKSADIFVLPSKKESFGLVLLEAMASSLPVIASDIPGIRSVIKKNYNGFLVEPTPENIAKAIKKLIKNPKLRERLAKNGLKEVKKYDWDKIVERFEDVYKEIKKCK